MTEPIDRGWFVITGVTFDTLATMEPSIAKLFSDHGVEDETKESPEIVTARAAFRARHDGHGEWRLNVIDFALRRITKRNPELRLAYYKYYAHNNLRDESKLGDHMDFDEGKNTGATAYGGTIINPKVLTLSAGDRFPTDDPVSLLAGTLIHEFAHTPQGGGENDVSAIQHEAKAYGIELFFSERMGDDKRAKVIGDMNWSTDSFKVGAGADKIFWHSYFGIKALYAVIDQGGAAAKEARDMSVEFISKESGDYSPKLTEFLAKV